MPRLRPLLALPLACLCVTLARADVITFRDGRTLEGKVVSTSQDEVVVLVRGTTIYLPLADVARITRSDAPEEAFARRVAALQAGGAADALALAELARERGWQPELRALLAVVRERGVVAPGNLRGALDLYKVAARTRGLDAEAAAFFDWALRAESLERATLDDLCALGAERLERGDPARARLLLVAAAARAPADPRLPAGLTALDFHQENGRWVPPEVYYPAHGYVRHAGRWMLPAERDVAVARDRLGEAEAAARAADEALARATAARDAAEAEAAAHAAERTRLEGDLGAAEAELRAREADLARAQERALAARRDLSSWCCACEPSACTHRLGLSLAVNRAEAAVATATRPRDQALALVEQLHMRIGRAGERETAGRAAATAARDAVAPAAAEAALLRERARAARDALAAAERALP